MWQAALAAAAAESVAAAGSAWPWAAAWLTVTGNSDRDSWLCQADSDLVQPQRQAWSSDSESPLTLHCHCGRDPAAARGRAVTIHATQGLVPPLRLWDHLCRWLAVNNTELSHKLVSKRCNFKFAFLHNPRQECSMMMVCSPSPGSFPPLNRVPVSPINPSSQHL